MLPWFIWREIIDYAVSIDKEYCLVNKEWFNYSAGRFIKLTSGMVFYNKKPPTWLKLAEELVLSEYDDLDWGFLLDCKNIKAICFYNLLYCYQAFFVNLQQLSQYSKVESIHLCYEDDMELIRNYEILVHVSKKIKTLKMGGLRDDLTHENWMELEYPNLTEYINYSGNWFVNFDQIHLNMPKIKHLSILANNVRFQQKFTNHHVFSTLKTLEIKDCGYRDEDKCEMFKSLFQCSFPVLISCELFLEFRNNMFQKIPKIMPKLIKLNLTINSNETTDLTYPLHAQPHLEKLYIGFHSVSKSNLLHIDLSKVPKVRELELVSQVELINYNFNHPATVQHVSLCEDFIVPTQPIMNKFSNINQIDISLSHLVEQFNEVSELFRFTLNLRIYNILRSIPKELLIPGPFKVQFFDLHGDFFLDNSFINWLANEFQLTKLKFKYRTKLDKGLTGQTFPHLKELIVDCNFGAEEETCLKSLIKMI